MAARGWPLALAASFLVSTALSEQYSPPPITPPPRRSRGAKGPRPWDLSVRVFWGYNDNVALVPDTTFFRGRKSSPYGGITLDGAYRFVQDADWVAGAGLRFDQVWYTATNPDRYGPASNDANDYNLTICTPRLFARRSFELAGRPASVGFAYVHRRDWMPISHGSAGYSRVHTLMCDTSVELCRNVQGSASYAVAFSNFDDDRANTPRDSRDGIRHTVGVAGTYFFHRRRRSLTLGYQWSNNNTRGDNFASDAHKVSARLESHLVGPLWFALSGSYADQDFGGFTTGWIDPPGRTRQHVRRCGVELLWVMTRHVTADFFCEHTRYDANQSRFEAENTNVGMGLTYRF